MALYLGAGLQEFIAGESEVGGGREGSSLLESPALLVILSYLGKLYSHAGLSRQASLGRVVPECEPWLCTCSTFTCLRDGR